MSSNTKTILVVFALAFILASPAQTQSPPEIPTRLWATQTSPAQLVLCWDTVPGASEYRLYQRTNTDKRIATAARNAQTWIIPLTAAMVGTTLQYEISAVNPKTGESPIVPFNAVEIRVHPGDVIAVRADLLEAVCPAI